LLRGINSSESQLSESEGRRSLQSTLARSERASESDKRDWGDVSPDSPAVNFDIGKMGTFQLPLSHLWLGSIYCAAAKLRCHM
jgi:hypothetical protein